VRSLVAPKDIRPRENTNVEYLTVNLCSIISLRDYCETQSRWSMTQCQDLECRKGVGKQMERQMRHMFRVVDWWIDPCRAVGIPGEWSESDYAIQQAKEKQSAILCAQEQNAVVEEELVEVV
jgi:hypothetical protein